MPLYDCLLMLKPQLKKEAIMELTARVGKHIYRRNGVVTEIKSFGKVNLGYGIKKLDGRYYEANLMQLTMMARPSINEELRYLNKEDRLLRWILVKNRASNCAFEEEDELHDPYMLQKRMYEDDDDVDDDDDDDDEVEQPDNRD